MTDTVLSDSPATTTDPPPLRIVGVVPPDSPENHLHVGPDGTYTVLLRLSRVTTASERHQAVRLAGDDVRLFGSTMTLSHTTLEKVASSSGEIATLLGEIEQSAEVSDSDHARAVARVAAEEETEVARRTALAQSISFHGTSDEDAPGEASPS